LKSIPASQLQLETITLLFPMDVMSPTAFKTEHWSFYSRIGRQPDKLRNIDTAT
jgi:hypothetical protein